MCIIYVRMLLYITFAVPVVPHRFLIQYFENLKKTNFLFILAVSIRVEWVMQTTPC